MKSPVYIIEKISGNTALTALVSNAFSECGQIVTGAAPEFFPEYTDHGAIHIDLVLRTSISLLNDYTKSRLTKKDWTVLALAALLHDLGMHLTGETFQKLIDPSNTILTCLDHTPWSTLWAEFLLEAKRFDGRKLREMFGSTNPIKFPPEDPSRFDHNDRLLIGEFLRRHHPRLAHEIAIFGFPSLSENRVRVIGDNDPELAEIAGLVARSHGMPIRTAVDVFDQHFNSREYSDIHPCVLMGALRVADFVQIQADRAPVEVSKYRKRSSPYSDTEWRVHQSVKNVSGSNDDPECVAITARPDDVQTFLRFKDWRVAFQSELDATWACLGEVYGRFEAEGLAGFGLKLRRIRTNIDNEIEFSSRVNFVPEKINFRTAGPDMLNLLVGPLYGHKPEIGLRELIQNAIDAVLERAHVEGTKPIELLADRDTDVVVYPVFSSDELVEIVVQDRGIGMSIEIIRDYFLNAGASFRSSDEWKRMFTSIDGRSMVSRSGRFGVGALAGFLLGNRMKVTTRRYDKDSGLSFVADLEASEIEISKVDCEIGTTIAMEIGQDARPLIYQFFVSEGDDDGQSILGNSAAHKWDFYCGNFPKLTRLDHKQSVMKPRFIFQPDPEWVRAELKDFPSVYWKNRYSWTDVYQRFGSANLYCNGIFVCDLNDVEFSSAVVPKLGENVTSSLPNLTIWDPHGKLPLNLQRDKITHFDENLGAGLAKSKADDLILETIAIVPEAGIFSRKGKKLIRERNLSCHLMYGREHRVSVPSFCWENNGWRIADLAMSAGKEWILVLFGDYPTDLAITVKMLEDVTVFWLPTNSLIRGLSDLVDVSPSRNHLINLAELSPAFWKRDTLSDRFSPMFVCLQKEKKIYAGDTEAGKSVEIGLHTEAARSLVGPVQEKRGDFLIQSNVKFEHPLIMQIKKRLTEVNETEFGFMFLGGGSRLVGTSEAWSYPLTRSWLRLLGEKSVPMSRKKRELLVGNLSPEMRDRILHHIAIRERGGSATTFERDRFN